MATLLSPKQYAKHRGVALSTIQYAIKSGRIPVILEGKNRKKIDD